MTESARQLPQLLTIAQAAEMLGMDAISFRRNIVNEGLIEFISLGSSTKGDRFHPDEVRRVLDLLRAGPRVDPVWDIKTLLGRCEIVYRRDQGWLEPQQIAEYLYVLKCHDAIKVGISQSPTRRVKDLQTANPFLIEIELVYKPPAHISSIDLERRAHAALAPFHLRGEWFQIEGLSLFRGEHD